MTLLRYLGDTTCEIIEISSDKKSYVYLKFKQLQILVLQEHLNWCFFLLFIYIKYTI